MIATDGTWTTADRHCCFLAGDAPPSRIGEPHKFVLIAVNEMVTQSGEVRPDIRESIETMLDNGTRLLIDSGVFWLTNEHKRAHGITMDEALSLPPDKIDGFDWLWKSYLNVHSLIGSRVWGMIELDQGGAVNKRKTRAKLNDLGIFPMPVYHPLNDGWDYFDEIAETHDRMCCGNVVQAQTPLRMRLIQTIAERHRKYPDLWVHLLGYTANQWVNALPVDSCDSSTWLSGLRWGYIKDQAMGKPFGAMPDSLIYRRGSETDDLDGRGPCSIIGASVILYQQRAWRHWVDQLNTNLGVVDYPAPGTEMMTA